MKTFIFIFFTVVEVMALTKNPKPQRKVANEACLEILSSAVLQSEATKVNVKPDKVKILEQRTLGVGAGTLLYSVFITSPSTADNTHWEIVGELNLEDGSCKAVYSKRFEAP